MASWHIYPLKKSGVQLYQFTTKDFQLMLQLYDVFLHNRRIYTQTHTHTHTLLGTDTKKEKRMERFKQRN